MNKKLVLLGAGLLLTAATASAQQHVTGKVTDSHGEPIMGATVRVAEPKLLRPPTRTVLLSSLTCLLLLKRFRCPISVWSRRLSM